MIPGLGSIIGAGAGFLGGLLDGDGGVGDANAMNMMWMRQIQNLWREQGQRINKETLENERRLQQRLDAVMLDFDRADANIGGSERSGIRTATEQGQQANSMLQQGLYSRGFQNSSMAENAQRGIAADQARMIADIQARAGQQRAGLAQNRAGMRASLMGDIAQVPLTRMNAFANNTAGYSGALQSFTAQPHGQSNGFGDLFGGLGSGLGGFIGGGGLGNLFGGGGGAGTWDWGTLGAMVRGVGGF